MLKQCSVRSKKLNDDSNAMLEVYTVFSTHLTGLLNENSTILPFTVECFTFATHPSTKVWMTREKNCNNVALKSRDSSENSVKKMNF